MYENDEPNTFLMTVTNKQNKFSFQDLILMAHQTCLISPVEQFVFHILTNVNVTF